MAALWVCAAAVPHDREWPVRGREPGFCSDPENRTAAARHDGSEPEADPPNGQAASGTALFQLRDPEEARRVFAATAFVDAGTKIVPQYWRHESPDEVFAAFSEGAVRATALLRAQPSEVREAVRSRIRAEVLKLRDGDRFVIPVPAALSYARKR